jgi:hypothetical protein
MQWCPLLNRFAAKQPSGNTIHWLTPSNPADPWNSSWAWSTETLAAAGGASSYTITDGSSQTDSFNRFVWVPEISSFIWATGQDNRVQAFRPLGT